MSSSARILPRAGELDHIKDHPPAFRFPQKSGKQRHLEQLLKGAIEKKLPRLRR